MAITINSPILYGVVARTGDEATTIGIYDNEADAVNAVHDTIFNYNIHCYIGENIIISTSGWKVDEANEDFKYLEYSMSDNIEDIRKKRYDSRFEIFRFIIPSLIGKEDET